MNKIHSRLELLFVLKIDSVCSCSCFGRSPPPSQRASQPSRECAGTLTCVRCCSSRLLSPGCWCAYTSMLSLSLSLSLPFFLSLSLSLSKDINGHHWRPVKDPSSALQATNSTAHVRALLLLSPPRVLVCMHEHALSLSLSLSLSGASLILSSP